MSDRHDVGNPFPYLSTERQKRAFLNTLVEIQENNNEVLGLCLAMTQTFLGKDERAIDKFYAKKNFSSYISDVYKASSEEGRAVFCKSAIQVYRFSGATMTTDCAYDIIGLVKAYGQEKGVQKVLDYSLENAPDAYTPLVFHKIINACWLSRPSEYCMRKNMFSAATQIARKNKDVLTSSAGDMIQSALSHYANEDEAQRLLDTALILNPKIFEPQPFAYFIEHITWAQNESNEKALCRSAIKIADMNKDVLSPLVEEPLLTLVKLNGQKDSVQDLLDYVLARKPDLITNKTFLPFIKAIGTVHLETRIEPMCASAIKIIRKNRKLVTPEVQTAMDDLLVARPEYESIKILHLEITKASKPRFSFKQLFAPKQG